MYKRQVILPTSSPQICFVFFILIFPPILFSTFIKAVLDGLSITSFSVIFDLGKINAPTIKKDALDGSPATSIFFALNSYGPFNSICEVFLLVFLILSLTFKNFKSLSV